MSGAPADGCRETPWRQDLAAAMLECAMSPVLETACAEALLASVMPALDARDLHGSTPLLENLRGFALRSTLVATAEGLLDHPDVSAASDSRGWRRSTLALGLAHALFELSDPVEGDSFQSHLLQDDPIQAAPIPGDMNALRIRYALGHMAAEPPDRLAAEMRHGRDEALDLLTETHHLLRLAASAWQLAHEGEAALGAVAALLDQAEGDVAASLRQVTEWESLLAVARSEAESRRLIGRFRSLATTLLPLADADSPAAVLAALERLLPQWLGQDILPLWVDAEGGLTVHGTSDLAGLRHSGPRSLAAKAVAQGRVTTQRIPARDGMTANAAMDIPVFDLRCAEWLGASSLLAVPVLAPEPIAVLLMNADAEAETEADTEADTEAETENLNLLGIHAARWLTRFAAFERQLQRAATEQSAVFRRRAREAVHEISNPLSVIQNYLHLLGTRIDDNGPAQDQVRLISDELRRAVDLLRVLTDEECPDSAPASMQQGTDVNALLTDFLSLVESSLPPGVPTDIRFTPGVDLPAPAAGDQRLQQIVLNLLKNALEAMPAGGILDVAVDRAANDRGDPGLAIRIADTGEGIDPALLEQIFEEGVSAKGEDRGLGLAIARRLLTEIGGEVSCRSHLGVGTTFVVWLPAARAASDGVHP